VLMRRSDVDGVVVRKCVVARTCVPSCEEVCSRKAV
jgi:hypothetical protein